MHIDVDGNMRYGAKFRYISKPFVIVLNFGYPPPTCGRWHVPSYANLYAQCFAKSLMLICIGVNQSLRSFDGALRTTAHKTFSTHMLNPRRV